MENISYERRVYESVDNSKEPTLGYNPKILGKQHSGVKGWIDETIELNRIEGFWTILIYNKRYFFLFYPGNCPRTSPIEILTVWPRHYKTRRSSRLLWIQSYYSPASLTTILRVVWKILCNLNIVGPSRNLSAEPKNRGTPPTMDGVFVVGN